MTQAKLRFSTFEEYLAYREEIAIEGRYELIAGELVELPPESPENDCFANYLLVAFLNAKIAPLALIRAHTCEVQVPVLQPNDAANRYPDLVILRPEHLDLMGRRLTVTREMPPPQLVVEVLSPGKANRSRDLINKRAQYAAIDIPEYWLIDPEGRTVTVLVLEDRDYAVFGIFQGNEPIQSTEFGALPLTAAQILSAGTDLK